MRAIYLNDTQMNVIQVALGNMVDREKSVNNVDAACKYITVLANISTQWKYCNTFAEPATSCAHKASNDAQEVDTLRLRVANLEKHMFANNEKIAELCNIVNEIVTRQM